MTPLVRHHYILVITPHDQIFVGPFDSAEEAHRYNDTNVWHDGYVMSAADWDCWHLHWTAEVCAKGYLREIRRKNGGIVLMHCIHSQSAALVEGIIPALVEEGYNFVRVDQIGEFKQYETPLTAPAVADAASKTLRTASNVPSADVK